MKMKIKCLALMVFSVCFAAFTAVADGGPVRVAMYVGSGARGVGVVYWLSILAQSKQLDVTPVDGAAVRAGALDKVELLVMPGGKSTDEAKELGAEGRRKIRDFLAAGGGYIGTCAGSYLLSESTSHHPDMLGVIPFRSEVRKGHLDVPVAFNARASELSGISNGVYQVLYSGGPAFVPAEALTNAAIEVVATYAANVPQPKDKSKPSMKGNAAAVAGPYGKGRLFVFAVHPEYDYDDRALIQGAFRYVTGREVTWPSLEQRTERPTVGVLLDHSLGVPGARLVVDLIREGVVNVRPLNGGHNKKDDLNGLSALVLPGDVECRENVGLPFKKDTEAVRDFLKKGGALVTWGKGAKPAKRTFGKGVVVVASAADAKAALMPPKPVSGPVLGYQLDVSRMKVPTMATICRIVDLLAKLGYNQFQLYTEHTFAYSKHETVWREASPMTPDEVRALDRYCAARGIELVPNQNSFGHFEQWLRHPEYNDLAELPQGGALVPQWGNYIVPHPTSLCPTDPRSIKLVEGLYDELLPCFRSKYVNVGCDETVELLDPAAPGRSHDAIAAKGATRVYLDYLIKVHELVAARGHEMMFWGDIMLYHPELLTELPQDVIALNWGYEAKHPFARETAALKKSGRRFIVCPGTSGWGSLFGRVTNMLGNIDNAVAAGSDNGALGYLLADWGDGGYPEPWIVAVPALVYLRDRVQGRNPTREELVAEINGLLGCTCGAALLGYGDVYLKAGGRQGNTSELFYLLRDGKNYVRAKGSSAETVVAAVAAAHEAAKLFVSDGASDWVRDDFALLDLLTRAVELRNLEPGKPNFRAIFEPEYRRLWLRQNRLGGLKDSLNLVFGP